MSTILKRASRNYLWRHPWQLALAILGITLGVAVVIAIDLAMESALQSFAQASRTVSGKASHRIMAVSGGLDEKIFSRLKVELGIENLSPVVWAYVKSKQRPNEKFKLYGIDPIVEKTFQTDWQIVQKSGSGRRFPLRLITAQNTALISIDAAQKLQLNINDRLSIITATGEQQILIVGLISATSAISRQVLENLIITDIASAQELLGLNGRLSYIEVMINDNLNGTDIPSKIRQVLPDNARLISSETQIRSMRQMTEAFAINLHALGLLSLLVGMFLIYNTMTFLVIQRRRLMGSLRSIGVTRRQIFQLILSEACLLAVLGTVLGIALGMLLGEGLVQLVATTINSIYFRIDAATLRISPLLIGKAIALGFGATLISVLPPAWEATRLSPGAALIRSNLEQSARKFSKTASLGSVFFLVAGLVVAMFSDTSIRLGLASIFLLLFGFALVTPGIMLLIMKPVESILGSLFGILGKLPPRMLSAEISRTGVATAALMIAVAAAMSMDLMIGSFRLTVAQWVRTSLQADLYVSLSGNKNVAGNARTDSELKAKIAALQGVDMLSSVLHTQVFSDQGITPLTIFDLNVRSRNGFIIKQGGNDIWRRFEQQLTILVTESYAYHHKFKLGEKIRLQTNRGKQLFEVIGIYADYSGDRGRIAMSRMIYQQFWPKVGFTGIGVYARKGTDFTRLKNDIHGLLDSSQGVHSSLAIYNASMAVFAQTFTITETLRWLAAAIAFVGIFSALMALQFERTRQLGILRAIGITPGQLTALISTETGLMGLVAGLFAMPVAYIVAYLLIFVVYQRSFGWTLAFHFHSAVLYQGVLLALTAALLAGIYPAIKMSRTRAAEALRAD